MMRMEVTIWQPCEFNDLRAMLFNNSSNNKGAITFGIHNTDLNLDSTVY